MHVGQRCVCTQCLYCKWYTPHTSEFAECLLLLIMTSFLWLHILHTNCPQLSLFQSWAPLSELYSMTWKNQTFLSLAVESYSLTLMQWSNCLRKAVRFIFHVSKMFWLSSSQWFIKMLCVLTGFMTQQAEVIVNMMVNITNSNMDVMYCDMATKTQQVRFLLSFHAVVILWLIPWPVTITYWFSSCEVELCVFNFWWGLSDC